MPHRQHLPDRQRTSHAPSVLARIAVRRPQSTTPESRALADAAIRSGRAHMALGAWPSALHEFARALELDTKVPKGRLFLLWAQWNTAESDVERRARRAELLHEIAAIRERDADDGFCYYVVGVLRLADGDHVRAERTLEHSLILDPTNRDAQRHLRIARMRRTKGP